MRGDSITHGGRIFAPRKAHTGTYDTTNISPAAHALLGTKDKYAPPRLHIQQNTHLFRLLSSLSLSELMLNSSDEDNSDCRSSSRTDLFRKPTPLPPCAGLLVNFLSPPLAAAAAALLPPPLVSGGNDMAAAFSEVIAVVSGLLFRTELLLALRPVLRELVLRNDTISGLLSRSEQDDVDPVEDWVVVVDGLVLGLSC